MMLTVFVQDASSRLLTLDLESTDVGLIKYLKVNAVQHTHEKNREYNYSIT